MSKNNLKELERRLCWEPGDVTIKNPEVPTGPVFNLKNYYETLDAQKAMRNLSITGYTDNSKLRKK